MDIKPLEKGLLHYTKKKKKWILVLGALGLFTGYGAYKVYYNLPSLVKKRQRLMKLFGAFFSILENASDTSDLIGILSKDVKKFLQSDSDEIPQSLKQVSKLMSSDEFSESLTRITRALTVGLFQGYCYESTKNRISSKNDHDFAGKIFDKLFSEAGSGFASVVVGSFIRNFVMAFFENADYFGLEPRQCVSNFIDVACDDKYRELIGDCIKSFVSALITIYLDKTKNINTYDEIFSGLTNPKHESQVRDMIVSVSNNAVETLIRTSYHVWTKNSSSAITVFDQHSSKIGYEDCCKINKKGSIQVKKLSNYENCDHGWLSEVSSTLAVPSNRKFVLDITGTVTFETMRSFLEILLMKLSDNMKRRVHFVHQEMADKGFEAARFVSSKSSTVTTLCLTLCLNILNSPWLLTSS